MVGRISFFRNFSSGIFPIFFHKDFFATGIQKYRFSFARPGLAKLGVGLFVFSVFAFSFLFLAPQKAHATPTTVVSNITNGYSINQYRNIFFNGSNFFVFYDKGSTSIYFKASRAVPTTSTTEQTLLNGALRAGYNWNIGMVSDSKFDVVYSDSSLQEIKVMTCDINGTAVTCGNASRTGLNDSLGKTYAVIRTPSSNRVWMAECASVYAADQTGDVTSSTTWTIAGSNTWAAGCAANSVVAYGSTEKIIVAAANNAAGSSSDSISYETCTYGSLTCTGETAGVDIALVANVTDAKLGNLIRISDTDFRLLYVDASATTKLIEAQFNGNATWTTTTNVDTGGGQTYPALFYSSTDNVEYAFYVDSSNKIQRYRKPTASTYATAWDSKTEVDASEADANSMPVTQMLEPPNSTARPAPGLRQLTWCYRNANSTNFDVVCDTLRLAPTTKFMESGTDATQGLEFYNGTNQSNGTETSDTSQHNSGPRSIKFNITSTTGFAHVKSPTGILADAGRRISIYLRFDTRPATGEVADFMDIMNGTTTEDTVSLGADGKLRITNGSGTVQATGTKVLAINTWYRITFSYNLAGGSGNNTAEVYVNGTNDISATNIDMSTTGATILWLGNPQATAATAYWGNASQNIWIDDVYVDNGTTGDTGDIHVTAKLPCSNGTTNAWATLIGTGANYCSGGTNHAQYVSERPLDIGNYVQTTSTSSTEEYTIQAASAGDVDISGNNIVDSMGWLYPDSSSAGGVNETLILQGVNSTINVTTTAVIKTAFAASSAYPSGGTDIGIISSATAGTYALYEAGVLFAYTIPYTITISSGNVLTSGQCSPGFAVSLTKSGVPTAPSQTTVVQVISTSSVYTVYSDASCSTILSGGNLTFTTSDTTKNFYIVDNVSGSPTITGTQTSGDTLNTGTQTYTVNAGPLDHYAVVAATPQTVAVCSTGTNTITAQDAYNNTITLDLSTVNMTTTGADITFYTASDCASSTTSYTLSSGTISFYYKTNHAQTVKIAATKSGSTQTGMSSNVVINGGTINSLIVTLPGENFNGYYGNSGTNTGATANVQFSIVQITAVDQYNNIDTTYTGAKTLAYAGPASTNGAPSYTTAVTFTNGVSTPTNLVTTLTTPETTTITVTDGGLYGLASSSLKVDVSGVKIQGGTTINGGTKIQ